MEQIQKEQQQQENAGSNYDEKSKISDSNDSDLTKTVGMSSLPPMATRTYMTPWIQENLPCLPNIHVATSHQEVKRIIVEGSSQLTQNQKNYLTQEPIGQQEVSRIKTKGSSKLTQEKNQNLEVKKSSTDERKHKLKSLLTLRSQAEEVLANAQNQTNLTKKHLEQCEYNKKKADQAVKNIVDSLSHEDPLWNERYKELIEFKAIFGHCNVKRGLPNEKASTSGYAQLGHWVAKLRGQAKLPPDNPRWLETYKVVAMNHIGFDWHPRENVWVDNYLNLKDYMNEHGRGAVPSKREDLLGAWCAKQVQQYNKYQANLPSNMNEQKIALLNEIGFIWDRKSSVWNQRYETLAVYFNKYGHCRIPSNYEDQVLFRWVSKERIKYRNFLEDKTPAQTQEQHQLLRRINFIKGFENGRKRKKMKIRLKGEDSEDIAFKLRNEDIIASTAQIKILTPGDQQNFF